MMKMILPRTKREFLSQRMVLTFFLPPKSEACVFKRCLSSVEPLLCWNHSPKSLDTRLKHA